MFYYCEGPNIIKQNITTKAECLRYPENRWRNQRYNFDNLGQALMSLFVLASKDGWVDIMYNGLDAVGVDQQVTKELIKNMMFYPLNSQDKITMSGEFCTSYHFFYWLVFSY